MQTILITPSSFGMIDKSPIKKLENSGFKVINNPFGRRFVKEELQEYLKGVSGLIAGVEPIDREVLEQSSLTVISRCGSGLDNIDLQAASDLNIKIRSTPNAPVESVAELTIGAILDVVRQVSIMNNSLHNGKWDKKIGCEIKSKLAVIIGFGRIGSRVAELLEAFGVNITVVDPNIKHCKYPLKTLNEILPIADLVLVHANSNKCILNKHEFSIIKQGVFIFNASRGNLVNEESFLNAIQQGKITGAWIDAFIEEPYVGKLTKYPQVILTPHVGSYTVECRKQMENEAVANLLEEL